MTRRVSALVHHGALFGTLAIAAACNGEPASAPAKPADAPAAAPAAPAANVDAPASDSPASADAPAIPPLSEEDLRLIAADPKTLAPEDVRKRAFALRRKIMQNPDSPAARALEDLRRATEAGDLQPPNAGSVQFEARTADGTPPKGSAPPAGVRESDTKAP